MVAWEVAIGRIKTASEDQATEFDLSLWQFSQLARKVKTGRNPVLDDELRLEAYRIQNYPHCVSRLRGAYFFESREAAEAALDKWNLRHRIKYISQVNFSAEAVTRVDSEWITSRLSKSDSSDWFESYWSGKPQGDEPLTEVLASGVGVVVEPELRKAAYLRIKKTWPTSTPLLGAAYCAFAYKKMEDIARVRPFLVRKDGALERFIPHWHGRPGLKNARYP